MIKQQISGSELKLKVLPELATSKVLDDIMKKMIRILHISCHGIDSRPDIDVKSETKKVEARRPRIG